MPVSGAVTASSRGAASMNATTLDSRAGTVVAAPASSSRAPVSSTPPVMHYTSFVQELLRPTKEAVSSMVPPGSSSRAPVSSAPPITQCASLVRELLQPTKEAVSSMVLPGGAGTAGAVDHDDEESVSLMRGAAGMSLDRTAAGNHGGNSSSTPSYGTTAAEFERTSNDDVGDEEPRGEPDRKPQQHEEQTESKAHRFLHGPSRLMHKVSGRDGHAHPENEDTHGAPELPGKPGRTLRFMRGPSHLMHKIAKDHHAHGGNESTTADDPEGLGSAKGSPEKSSERHGHGHSHKWHRPHWHHKKHDSK